MAGCEPGDLAGSEVQLGGEWQRMGANHRAGNEPEGEKGVGLGVGNRHGAGALSVGEKGSVFGAGDGAWVEREKAGADVVTENELPAGVESRGARGPGTEDGAVHSPSEVHVLWSFAPLPLWWI